MPKHTVKSEERKIPSGEIPSGESWINCGPRSRPSRLRHCLGEAEQWSLTRGATVKGIECKRFEVSQRVFI